MKSAVVVGYKLKEMTRRTSDLMVPLFFPLFFTLSFAFAMRGLTGPTGRPYFDYLVPGMVVFALLLLTVGVSGTLAREAERGTLTRLRLTLMSSFDLLLGVLLVWGGVAVVQVVVLFGTAVGLGFQWTGGLPSLLAAMLVAALSGIASVALGLIIAAFARSEGEAGNLSTLVAVPLGFLVDAFYPMKLGWIARALPWGNASQAMRALLSDGASVAEVAGGVGLMVFETAALFALAVALFSRRRLEG